MEYLKEFEKVSEYDAFISGNPLFPNVSSVIEDDSVRFNPRKGPSAKITAITFTNLTWAVDIPATGGTATSANCTFTITGIDTTGGTTDMTALAIVLGQQNVASSTVTTRHTAGTLNLTAQVSALTCSDSVAIYQAAYVPTITAITFASASWDNSKDIPASGGTATKANCSYTIEAIDSTGGTTDITTAATVNGSLNVPASTVTTRHTAGTITLTAEYMGFNATTSVTVYQAAYVISITAISFTQLEWDEDKDIPALGGTATNYNCIYTVTATNSTGGTTDITTAATVNGSLNVPASTVTTRHTAGTITLTVEYSDATSGTLTATGSTSIYQEGYIAPVNCITFTSTDEQEIGLIENGSLSSVNVYYSFDNTIWDVLPKNMPVPFANKGGCYQISIIGKNKGFSLNNTNYYNFRFTKPSTVSIDGNVMLLIDYTRPYQDVEIPSKYCFTKLFENDYQLTGISQYFLPKETLTEGCYCEMFKNCSGLTSAPALNTETLEKECYAGMFLNCNSLQEIICEARNISAADCTTDWVQGVYATGIFHGKTAANWPDGNSGIPNGWTKDLT